MRRSMQLVGAAVVGGVVAVVAVTGPNVVKAQPRVADRAASSTFIRTRHFLLNMEHVTYMLNMEHVTYMIYDEMTGTAGVGFMGGQPLTLVDDDAKALNEIIDRKRDFLRGEPDVPFPF